MLRPIATRSSLSLRELVVQDLAQISMSEQVHGGYPTRTVTARI